MDRTPSAHTLAGVLTRLHAGEDAREPDLARLLDRAFAKHLRGLSAFVARELRPASAAVVEEVVQDVLVDAWRKLPAYRPDAPFRSYLYAIAARRCQNARRKRSDALSADGLIEGQSDATALGELLAAERNALVEEALQSALDDLDREIAYLRYVEDYAHAQIAEQLGLEDVDEVRVALQRIRRRLGAELERRLAARGQGASLL